MRKIIQGILVLGLLFNVACNANRGAPPTTTTSAPTRETTQATLATTNLDSKPHEVYYNTIRNYRANTAYFKPLVERDDSAATIFDVEIPFPEAYEGFIEGATSAGRLFFTLEKTCPGSYDDEGYVPYLYEVGAYDIHTGVYTSLQTADPGYGVKYLANNDQYVMWSEYEGHTHPQLTEAIYHLQFLPTAEEKTFTIDPTYTLLGTPVIDGDVAYFTVVKDRIVTAQRALFLTAIYQFDFATGAVAEIYAEGRFPLVTADGIGFVQDDSAKQMLILYDRQQREMMQIPYGRANQITPVFGGRSVFSRDIFSVTANPDDIPAAILPYMTGTHGLSGCGIRQLLANGDDALAMCINDEIIGRLSVVGSALTYATTAEQKPVYYDLATESFVEIGQAPVHAAYCGFACQNAVVFVAKTSADRAEKQTYTVVHVPLA